MRGTGEKLGPALNLPRLYAVLVNPGVSFPTRNLFGGYFSAAKRRRGRTHGESETLTMSALVTMLVASRNDLEPAAIALQPAIADVLAALRERPGCRLARMSGSGATCFGLFVSARSAARAAQTLRRRDPNWWVRTSVLGKS
jgi:4-diphosphocytidyl-2-C-methyl-D-erythritol kinase